MKHWLADGRRSLGQVLREVFADETALTEGRVFVARARARDAGVVPERGVRVEVGLRRSPLAQLPEWLHRDEHLAVVCKPAGLPTIPDHGGDQSLLAWVAEQCRRAPADVHPSSRLDRDVSGVVVFALDARAQRALAIARERGDYRRRYVALTAKAPTPAAGSWQGAIGKAKDARRRMVGGKEPLAACTHYAVAAQRKEATLLAVSPLTGRTHQIRVHAAHAGVALDGDITYGGRRRLTLDDGRVLALDRIALHAAWVELPEGLLGAHPALRFDAPIPDALATTWRALGGVDLDWDRARALDLHTAAPRTGVAAPEKSV